MAVVPTVTSDTEKTDCRTQGYLGPPHKFISHSCGDPPREDEKALCDQSICLMFQSLEAFECRPLPSSAVYQSRLAFQLHLL